MLSPEKLVDGLNDLLAQDPVGVTKMFETQHVLNISKSYAEKMIFVCGISKDGVVSTGILGMLNSLLLETPNRIYYTRKDGEPIHSFGLLLVEDVQ